MVGQRVPDASRGERARQSVALHGPGRRAVLHRERVVRGCRGVGRRPSLRRGGRHLRVGSHPGKIQDSADPHGRNRRVVRGALCVDGSLRLSGPLPRCRQRVQEPHGHRLLRTPRRTAVPLGYRRGAILPRPPPDPPLPHPLLRVLHQVLPNHPLLPARAQRRVPRSDLPLGRGQRRGPVRALPVAGRRGPHPPGRDARVRAGLRVRLPHPIPRRDGSGALLLQGDRRAPRRGEFPGLGPLGAGGWVGGCVCDGGWECDAAAGAAGGGRGGCCRVYH
mmetsp:Transcript_64138/g.153005  ORF Transcript_64138/g.153005 Transcript_64138/m.153005 type:complete len:277 (-) Transcript_64138:306-1136(-)